VIVVFFCLFKAITWEQRELGDVVDFYSGLTYSPSDVDENADTLVLRSSNVKGGEIVDADNVYVDSSVAYSENVKQGDIVVVVRNGSRALIGKHAQIKRKMDNTVIGAFMTGVRYKNSEFLNALLSTHHFEEEIEKDLGATINQITTGSFKKMTFKFPLNDEEQIAIGTYFKNLDTLITLHQRKCKNISLIYANPWEQRELGDLLEKKISNGIMNRESTTETGIKHINVVNMYTPDKIHINDLTWFDGTEKDIEKCDVKYGDVFVTRSSLKVEGIAEPNVLLDYGRFVFDDHLMQLRLSKECSPLFCKILLGTKHIKTQFMTKSKTTTMTTIGQEDITSSVGLFPKLEEQKKIADYFQNLDTLITLHQRKLKIGMFSQTRLN